MEYNLYLITDPVYDKEKVISALKGRVDLLQLREKNLSTKQFYNKALELKEICLQFNTLLIINDRLDIALAIDADGLHIGQDDLDIKICKRLFPNKIIGVSVTSYEEALLAEENGASYIGVGAMFKTNTKEDAKYVELEELRKIKDNISIPVVCIGGINLENAKQLLDYNVDGLAICSDILSDYNPRLKVCKYRELFSK